MKQENIIIPEINNEFEKFNESFLEKNQSRKIISNKISTIIYTRAKIGFGIVTSFNQSYFKYLKSFYPNKGIRKKGLTLNEGSDYGIWYEFDENGKLIKEINTDKGYEFSWKDIIKYCERNKILLTKGYKEFDGFQTSIFKNEIDSKKVWEITYQISGDEVLKITLDGVTGEVLKREKQEFMNH